MLQKVLFKPSKRADHHQEINEGGDIPWKGKFNQKGQSSTPKEKISTFWNLPEN